MTKTRALGPIEQVLWKLDRAGSMNFTLVAELDSAIDPEALHSALKILSTCNPRLGASIENVKNSAPLIKFDPARSISLRIVERSSDDTWHSELEYELNQPIDWEAGPLARSTLVLGANECELLITLHHAVGDANSGILLARDIFKLLGRAESFKLPTGKTDSVMQSMGLARTTMGFRLRTFGFGIRQLLDTLLFRPKKLPADAYVRPSGRKTRVIHATLPAETTTLLKRAAREHGTTVHGALCAVLMIIAYEDIRSRRHKRKDARMHLACMSPVNMRKYCPESSSEDVGFYVSTTVVGSLLEPEQPFWFLAEDLSSKIHRKIRADEPLMTLALQGGSLSSVHSPGKLASRIEKMIAAAVGVTNIGVVNHEDFCKGLNPRAIHYAAAVNAIAGTGFLCSAVTFRDQLRLNFQYASPLICDARAQQLANRAVSTLAIVANKPTTVAELVASYNSL